MSYEEDMKIPVYKAWDTLWKIINQKTVDWNLFDLELKKIPDINVIHDEDTILSELYHGCPSGTILVEITKRFLDNGYDVAANEGLNGAACLNNLCWATFDKYILDAAKLLLAAGADTKISIDEDVDGYSGIKGSISWRLGGDWVYGSYTVANIFEAFWQLVEAFDEGKDYRSICAFEDCIGEPLRRAEFIASEPLVQDGAVTMFDGYLVLWFGEKPLVVSKYIDFVINPILVKENVPKTVAGDLYLKPLLNARLTRFIFIDQCTAQLQFDNGMHLLLSNTDYRNREHRRGLFEICGNDDAPDLRVQKIDDIFLEPGRVYSDTSTQFSEQSVALACGEKAFLLHKYPEDYGNDYEIRVIKCSIQFIQHYDRKLVLPNVKYQKSFFHQKKQAGIRFSCGPYYFYLIAGGSNALHMKLSEEKITSWKALSTDSSSIEFKFQLISPEKWQ